MMDVLRQHVESREWMTLWTTWCMTWMTWRVVGHVRGTPMLRGVGTRGTAGCVVCVAGGHRDALRRGRRRASGGESGDPQMDSWSRKPLVCIRQVASVGGTGIYNDFPTINISTHMKGYLAAYA